MFNTTYLNSADVSPWMEIAPKSSFNMIRSGHGNKKTSPLCLQVYVPYGLDTEIQVQVSVAKSRTKKKHGNSSPKESGGCIRCPSHSRKYYWSI